MLHCARLDKRKQEERVGNGSEQPNETKEGIRIEKVKQSSRKVCNEYNTLFCSTKNKRGKNYIKEVLTNAVPVCSVPMPILLCVLHFFSIGRSWHISLVEVLYIVKSFDFQYFGAIMNSSSIYISLIHWCIGVCNKITYKHCIFPSIFYVHNSLWFTGLTSFCCSRCRLLASNSFIFLFDFSWCSRQRARNEFDIPIRVLFIHSI